MKLKIFVTTFVFLLVTAMAVSSIHFYFFKTERMRLIDQQVEAIASTLFASDLSINELDDLEAAQNIISEVLGAERMIALITIIDPTGQVQYRNRASSVLDLPVDLRQRWQTLEEAGHTVRVLNLKIPNSTWYIQLGLLLDEVQVEWRNLSRAVYFYISLTLLIMLGSAAVLTRLLLRPMRALSGYLRHFADTVGTAQGPAQLPASLVALDRKKKPRPLDEFGELITSVGELGRKLQSRFRLNQATSAQMAHEFKTPLTIVKNSLEAIDRNLREQNYAELSSWLKSANQEADHLGVVITEFLEWSRLEFEKTATEGLFALKASDAVDEARRRLDSLYPQRLQIEVESDFTLFARPEWAQQFLKNILENGLRYSPSTASVRVRIEANKITVEDEGEGLPPEVLKRLGQPFNVSAEATRSSTGLGLAWVSTIAKLYGWNLEFLRREDRPGTRVIVTFPS